MRTRRTGQIPDSRAAVTSTSRSTGGPRAGASMKHDLQLTGQTGVPCAAKSAITKTPRAPGFALTAGPSFPVRKLKTRRRNHPTPRPDPRPKATNRAASHRRSARTCAACATEPNASARVSDRPGRVRLAPAEASLAFQSWSGVWSPLSLSRSFTRCQRCNSHAASRAAAPGFDVGSSNAAGSRNAQSCDRTRSPATYSSRRLNRRDPEPPSRIP